MGDACEQPWEHGGLSLLSAVVSTPTVSERCELQAGAAVCNPYSVLD